MTEDDDIDEAAVQIATSGTKRKRLLILLLPVLIVVGISATLFYVLQRNNSNDTGEYNIVQYNKDNADNLTVFYDLPEITTSVRGHLDPHELRLKLNLELSSIEDL